MAFRSSLIALLPLAAAYGGWSAGGPSSGAWSEQSQAWGQPSASQHPDAVSQSWGPPSGVQHPSEASQSWGPPSSSQHSSESAQSSAVKPSSSAVTASSASSGQYSPATYTTTWVTSVVTVSSNSIVVVTKSASQSSQQGKPSSPSSVPSSSHAISSSPPFSNQTVTPASNNTQRSSSIYSSSASSQRSSAAPSSQSAQLPSSVQQSYSAPPYNPTLEEHWSVSASIAPSSSSSPAASASKASALNGASVVSSCTATLDGKLPAQTADDFEFSGNVRTYYVSVDQDEWDYAPTGWDNWLGVPLSSSPRAQRAGILHDDRSPNTKWEKALYRGYTDATFSKLSEQMPTQGIQGPLIRAEVGDMIQILFINRLSQNYASMHSMGLAYPKLYEGSLYADTTSGNIAPVVSPGDMVGPGECFVYKWLVSNASAPASNEPSRMFSYHSFVNMEADMNAGLVGPLIVYKPGQMNSTMAAYREFVVLFETFDEGGSWLAPENNASAATGPTGLLDGFTGNETVWKPQLANIPGNNELQLPFFHSINGYVFSNGPAFSMCQDDSVIWYVMAYGSMSHVFHLHGNNFLHDGRWTPAQGLNDGDMDTFFMLAELPGVWQVICHVAWHLSFGMVANYQIYPKDSCPLPALNGQGSAFAFAFKDDGVTSK